MMVLSRIVFLFFGPFVFLYSLSAEYQIKEGRLIDSAYIATESGEEHYQSMLQASYRQDWKEVLREATIIQKNFPQHDFFHEVLFYEAVAFFHQRDYGIADQKFSEYLKQKKSHLIAHLEESLEYKYQIAEQFRHGEKKRFLGLHSFPKWLPASGDAIAIYDEILENYGDHSHLLSAKSLFAKGSLLVEMKQFEEGLAALDTLIEKFPNTDFAFQAYVKLSQVYHEQMRKEIHHPDLLFLAEMNMQLFARDFPQHEAEQREMKRLWQEMREVRAVGIFEIAQFYERKKHFEAARVYYQNILEYYAETNIVEKVREEISSLPTSE